MYRHGYALAAIRETVAAMEQGLTYYDADGGSPSSGLVRGVLETNQDRLSSHFIVRQDGRGFLSAGCDRGRSHRKADRHDAPTNMSSICGRFF